MRSRQRPVVGLILVAGVSLAACGTQPGATADVPVPGGLGDASAGLCNALAALPDVTEAERTFTNQAHEPLHALAADDRLDRTMAAAVLEAMEGLESDFADDADVGTLSVRLQALKDATDAGLQAIGEELPACDG